jgi:hypothetical protein
VLLGAAAFVVGCFLPYIDPTGEGVPAGVEVAPRSMYRMMMTMRATAGEVLGALLSLFGGVAVLASIALLGVRRPRAWTVVVLIPTSVVWALQWIGSFLGPSELLERKGAGYWVMLVGVAVVLVGATMVWASSRGAQVEWSDDRVSEHS